MWDEIEGGVLLGLLPVSLLAFWIVSWRGERRRWRMLVFPVGLGTASATIVLGLILSTRRAGNCTSQDCTGSWSSSEVHDGSLVIFSPGAVLMLSGIVALLLTLFLGLLTLVTEAIRLALQRHRSSHIQQGPEDTVSKPPTENVPWKDPATPEP
jgi:hypothetical protein